jgi:hypothetical protein
MNAQIPTPPVVQDPIKRALRTLVQTGIPSFLTLAAGFPAVAEQFGVFLSPRMRAALVALAGAITAAATLLSLLMNLPAVNYWLAKIGLAGHSGPEVEADSLTRAQMLPWLQPSAAADAFAAH